LALFYGIFENELFFIGLLQGKSWSHGRFTDGMSNDHGMWNPEHLSQLESAQNGLIDF
jgi:hypothetical protein